ncbi:MAG: PP2C family protein-serine/threonine phosphatase [Methanohalobium sp.]|uniref:PP2C family protein-serine/threonine phosphatase n=1 Tax=Methanohalobium sp. TaxID=2837493 RepID=UPI003979B88B
MGELLTLNNRVSGITDSGNRDHNEDNCLMLKIDDAYLLAVADGLGGHAAGDIASGIAVMKLEEFFKEQYSNEMDNEQIKDLLRDCHERIHDAIIQASVGDKQGMGTTLVSAFVKNNRAIIANTGDSRSTVVAAGTKFKTKDHSMVQKLLDRGMIDDETARYHPMSHIVTHSMGNEFDVDLYETTIDEGEILVLSSDGLHDHVDKSVIVKSVTYQKPSEIVRYLYNEALVTTTDNVTIVVYKP